MVKLKAMERSKFFLDFLKKVFLCTIICLCIVTGYIMISTEKFFANFVALICCIGVCLILGISINVIEQRINLKNLEIENYKIYKILMKKKGSIEVVPRNYKIFKRAQEMRDKNGLDVRFYAKAVSEDETEIKCLMYVDDHIIPYGDAIKVSNFLEFNNDFYVK